MKKSSGNPNLPTKTGNYLPNIEQTKQVIQQAKVNDKALSNILNSRDPEFWLGKVRAALDKEAWTEAAYYGLKALFYDETFIKADIVLAYTFGRLQDIDKSLFYIEKVDRFGEVEAEVYRSLLSREELYFLSVWFEICYMIKGDEQFFDYAKKIEEVAEPIKAESIKLDLICNQLTNLPKEIGQLTNLTLLNLWDNQLKSLPKEIGQLTNLTSLRLLKTQLTSLPKEIGQLTKLSKLSLFNNQLTSLPKEIGQLTKLTELDLSENKFSNSEKERIKNLLPNCKIDF